MQGQIHLGLLILRHLTVIVIRMEYYNLQHIVWQCFYKSGSVCMLLSHLQVQSLIIIQVKMFS